MSIVISPLVACTGSVESVLCESQAIVRIGINDITSRIIAGRVIIAIFEKVNLMSETSKPQNILEMMPSESPNRPPNNIAENNDAKAVISRPH
jgi:hypothetical protein